MERKKAYYLGLDIGTDSVGYAVTDRDYKLLKYKGEPMWGTTLFETAGDCANRRMHRTGRRRIDRRQQRISLLTELFAQEIVQIDPHFFQRRKESALHKGDAEFGVKLFQGEGITDREYHQKYPTIHHLILDLMQSEELHDVRLVFLACAWLVAHRGHFLFDIAPERIGELLDFECVYQDFWSYFQDRGYDFPWNTAVQSEEILMILQMETGVRGKEDAFKKTLFGGKKIPKEISEQFPFNRESIVKLLSGSKDVKPADLYGNEMYADFGAVSLSMDEEDFMRTVSELGEDGELLQKLRTLKDCAQLIDIMQGKKCISEGKVAVYEQHRKDLKLVKYLVKKYCPEQFDEIFRDIVPGNYVFYTRNVKSCSEEKRRKLKSTTNKKVETKDEFSDFLEKRMKKIAVQEEDRAAYEDMMQRLQARTFLPKQRDGDNRVIPQQLYRYELAEILRHAQDYLPFLEQSDEDGMTVKEKVLSVFDFRIPYYVGPLKENGGKNTWLKRKQQGKILPWNFEKMVDLDESEQRFIRRMTNTCTYLPGEDVLPVNSLLYSKFTVLNELNNLKINGDKIPTAVKQAIYTDVYEQYPRVTPNKIRDYLFQHGYMTKQDTLSGMDVEVRANLKSYHVFKNLLESGTLNREEVETIIQHMAYTEEKSRFRKWLEASFPKLRDEDVRYVVRQNLKEFGRLSRRFLTGVYGTEVGSDGEAFTIMEMLWNTNDNLMQLLSDKYTFREQVEDISRAYYAERPQKLNDRMDDMYISNAVKRQIFQSLNVVRDVVKAPGQAPEKIFVEMARGGSPEKKGKRTQSRKKQLIELYRQIKTEDSRQLMEELERMGEMGDNRLQSDRLFLYYLQLGKCAYTGKPIELAHLMDGTYNLDHIYPQCHVKDDSVLNNLVLVTSEANGNKKDTYPVPGDIQNRMQEFWRFLKENGMMTEEKYRRLTRKTPFTAEERQGFINRQLVETRQSTKAVCTLLKEMYPETEIVYVKAGLVSEFRQEFQLRKSRAVNDLHHAKDAYLNIVVGNVYHERFTKKWFCLDEKYNVQVKKIFEKEHRHGAEYYWHGEQDVARIKKIMRKDAVHLTRYAFCRKGGLFDQQPVKKGEGLIPLKKGLPTEKYGGYNKPTASFFVMTRFTLKGKREVMIVPVNLMDARQFREDSAFALQYAENAIFEIIGKKVDNLELLFGGRPLKVNTVFSLDGALVTLAGKSSGGRVITVSPLLALKIGPKWESYIRSMETYQKKRKTNKEIRLDEDHDHISRRENEALYALLTQKMGAWPFSKLPNNQAKTLREGTEKFRALETEQQVLCLLNILTLFGAGADGVDLSEIGGATKAGVTSLSSKLSNWKKNYQDVCIVHMSASGLFENRSENLLELL